MEKYLQDHSGHKLSFHSLLVESHRLLTADQLDGYRYSKLKQLPATGVNEPMIGSSFYIRVSGFGFLTILRVKQMPSSAQTVT